jgi:hypothetical protein
VQGVWQIHAAEAASEVLVVEALTCLSTARADKNCDISCSPISTGCRQARHVTLLDSGSVSFFGMSSDRAFVAILRPQAPPGHEKTLFRGNDENPMPVIPGKPVPYLIRGPQAVTRNPGAFVSAHVLSAALSRAQNDIPGVYVSN